MGVYIKGMKMPTNCRDCGIACERYLSVNGLISKICLDDRVHPDCPLIELTPHGRLIDADALEQDAQKRLLLCNKYNDQFQKPYEVMRAIALAPTIIPAEEGE